MAGATTGTAFYDPNEILGSQKLVNDSMATMVTNLSAKDSPLNQMARTEGLKAANRRGMLNSSMAIGASQDAVLKNIMPIASQDSAQAFGKNQAAKAFEYGLTGQVQQQGWQTGERLGAQAWQTGERKGAEAWQTGERLGAQAFAKTEADLNRKLETLLQKNQITSAEKLAFAQIASTEGINAANNKLSWNMFVKDLAVKVSEGKLNRAQALALQNDAQAFESQQNKFTRDLQTSIAKMNLSGTQQKGLSDAIGSANLAYQAGYQTIMSNPDLDAATRTQQLGNLKTHFNNYINAVQRLYNVNVKWGK